MYQTETGCSWMLRAPFSTVCTTGDDNYPDSHVFAEGECLRKTFDPDFMLYHTMAVDELGAHERGRQC